jgi:dihydroorotate dehydrogenase (fumarate)
MPSGRVDLSVEIFGRTIPNPLIVASGPFVKNDRDIVKCLSRGAAGVVTKTVTFDRMQQVQPKPRMHVVFKDALVRGGFYSFYSVDLMSEYAPEQWVAMLRRARVEVEKWGLGGLIVASVAGRDYEEWERLTELIASAEVDAIETNLSCPHIEPGRALMGRAAATDPEVVRNILKVVKSAAKGLPVIGKITPHGANPLIVARAMKEGGADAVVSTARYQGLIIDVETLQPIVWGGYGGYGGPWQLPISLAWTSQIAREGLGIPIIGSGGVSSGEDIARFILVGAHAVQACTSILLHGLSFIGRMLNELKAWMERKGFTSLEEFRGLALQKIKSLEQLNREKLFRIEVNPKCRLCGRCAEVCPYEALRVEGGALVVDEERCDNCGLCLTVCPFDAIAMRPLANPA